MYPIVFIFHWNKEEKRKKRGTTKKKEKNKSMGARKSKKERKRP